MYFNDLDYKKFLEDIVFLTQDKEKFKNFNKKLKDEFFLFINKQNNKKNS